MGDDGEAESVTANTVRFGDLSDPTVSHRCTRRHASATIISSEVTH